MKISYKSRKLERSVATPGAIKTNYGTRAKLVNIRLEELASAKNLETMRNITKANCHELSGNRQGELTVDISGNHRIIFIPDHDPIPLKPDGGMDWLGIAQIIITEIGEDYH